MNTRVTAAGYVEYNANNRGTRTTDCVARAISLAFEKPYHTVIQDLNNMSKQIRTPFGTGGYLSYKTSPVYRKLIKNYGGGQAVREEDKPLLTEWADNHPSGTYILEVMSIHNWADHLVCVIDGVIYDSWDSRDSKVDAYIPIENASHEFTDIKDSLDRLAIDGQDDINELAQKYIAKYNIPDAWFSLYDVYTRGYSIHYGCRLTVLANSENAKIYRWKMSVVYTPTTSVEEAEKKLHEVIKVRMYDRFYEVSKKISGMSEGYDLYAKSGHSPITDRWMDKREERFYNTLPAIIRPFVEFLQIRNPGQYHDSYSVKIKPLPGDPRFQKDGGFWLDAYDSDIMKDMIKRYIDKYEREGEDYLASEEY